MSKDDGRPKTTIANQSVQSVYAYYAYRMDISAFGVGAKDGIARACKGSGPGGSCNFDEFMKHLTTWKGKTDIGGNLYPEPMHAASELHADKNGFKNNFNDKTLFPEFPYDPGNKPSLSEVQKRITDRIQLARLEKGDAFFDKELQNARLMISCAREGRLLEHADNRIKAINQKLADAKITWVCRLVHIFLRLLVIRAAGS
jgi:hypothetical protein